MAGFNMIATIAEFSDHMEMSLSGTVAIVATTIA